MEIAYLPADSSHVETLVELMRELYLYDQDELDEAMARTALDAFFAGGAWGRAWLLADGSRIAGYVVLTFGFSMEYGGRDATIDELYLRESYRGLGIGAQVIEFLKDFCRAEGINALQLEVFEHNAGAYHFYRRHGFRERASRLMSLKL